MSLIVLCFDRLPTSLLGPYGNTLFSTPAFNHFAATGLTVEYAFRASCQLHPLECLTNLTKKNQSKSQNLCWIKNPLDPTDSARTTPVENQFEYVWDQKNENQKSAEQPEESQAEENEELESGDWSRTQQARFLLDALTGLEEYLLDGGNEPDGLIWVDLPALSTKWDAPSQWSTSLLGEEDPELPEDFCSSKVQLAENWDEDVLASIQTAAGAQAMLSDHCLETFLTAIEELPATVIITAKEGYSLGEHQTVGPDSSSCFSEQTHVPLLIRPKGGMPYGVRIPGTQQAEDWIDWVQGFCQNQGQDQEAGGAETFIAESIKRFRWTNYSLFPARAADSQTESRNTRNTAISFAAKDQQSWQLSIRTDAWSANFGSDQQSPNLYVRPDDRWESNDISSRAVELSEQFGRLRFRLAEVGLADFPVALRRFHEHANAGEAAEQLVDSEPKPGQEKDDPSGGRWAEFPDQFWHRDV